MGGLWKQSPLSQALRVFKIAADSPEETHYLAMRDALSATRRSGLKDDGEHACIAVCATLPGAIFVSHDAGAIRLAVSEIARVSPVTARVATTSELLRTLREHGALSWEAVDAIVAVRGSHSQKLPDPSWWRPWLESR